MMSNSAYSSFEMIFEKTFHLREDNGEHFSSGVRKKGELEGKKNNIRDILTDF